MTTREKIIPGWYYTCDPKFKSQGSRTIKMTTGHGGALALYDKFIEAGMTDAEVGAILGIATKDHPFIPLALLEVKEKEIDPTD